MSAPWYIRADHPNADLRVGERVIVPSSPSWGTLVVERADDPAMLLVSAGSGLTLRVGRTVVERASEPTDLPDP